VKGLQLHVWIDSSARMGMIFITEGYRFSATTAVITGFGMNLAM
jgi:hypothetical protein